MHLEQKMRYAQMQMEECVDPFLTKLKETHDELFVAGHTPQDSELIRLDLNSVSDEWQVFVQSILGRAALPNWDEMCATLKQEELRRDLVKCKLDGSNNSGSKPKEEEENATLASKGKKEQRKKKKDVSKIKCFRCGELSHYATQCLLRKKEKDEKHDLKVAAAKIKEDEFSMTAAKIKNDEFSMIAEIPPGGRWADLEL